MNKLITMKGKYRLRGTTDKPGDPVQVLTVNRPDTRFPVVVMHADGGVYVRMADGSCTHGKNSELDLVEIGLYNHIQINDKVLVWNYDQDKSDFDKSVHVFKGHFAGIDENGNPTTWRSGSTSWSVPSRITKSRTWWNYCKLA